MKSVHFFLSVSRYNILTGEKRWIFLNILSLDQATNKTGYAYFEKGKLIDYGVVDLSNSSNDAVVRVFKLAEWFNEYVKDKDIDHVGLEQTQLQPSGGGFGDRNPYVFQLLSKTLGILEHQCYLNELEYTIISASSWKSTCGVRGRKRKEQKDNARKFVASTYDLNVPQDIVDAICLGHHLITEELNEDEWAFGV